MDYNLVYNKSEGWYHIVDCGNKINTPKKNTVEPFETRENCVERVVELGIDLNPEDV